MKEIKCPGDCTDTGCCAPIKPKPVIIDYLYLDLETCDRCQDTLSMLNEAIEDLSLVLNSAGLYIEINKTLVDSKEKAIANRFISSPTIRINGRDIDSEAKETNCCCCSDICGDDVDCRVWSYEGKEYSYAPKKLIMNAILKAIYSEQEPVKEQEYTLPGNLEKFFASKDK